MTETSYSHTSEPKHSVSRWRDMLALIAIMGTLLLFLSLVSYHPEDPSWNTAYTDAPKTHNWLGLFGAYWAGLCLSLLGYHAYLLVLIGVWFALGMLLRRQFRLDLFAWMGYLSFAALTAGGWHLVLGIRPGGFSAGGVWGEWLARKLVEGTGTFGAFLVLGFGIFLSALITTQFSISAWLLRCVSHIEPRVRNLLMRIYERWLDWRDSWARWRWKRQQQRMSQNRPSFVVADGMASELPPLELESTWLQRDSHDSDISSPRKRPAPDDGLPTLTPPEIKAIQEHDLSEDAQGIEHHGVPDSSQEMSFWSDEVAKEQLDASKYPAQKRRTTGSTRDIRPNPVPTPSIPPLMSAVLHEPSVIPAPSPDPVEIPSVSISLDVHSFSTVLYPTADEPPTQESNPRSVSHATKEKVHPATTKPISLSQADLGAKDTEELPYWAEPLALYDWDARVAPAPESARIFDTSPYGVAPVESKVSVESGRASAKDIDAFVSANDIDAFVSENTAETTIETVFLQQKNKHTPVPPSVEATKQGQSLPSAHTKKPPIIHTGKANLPADKKSAQPVLSVQTPISSDAPAKTPVPSNVPVKTPVPSDAPAKTPVPSNVPVKTPVLPTASIKASVPLVVSDASAKTSVSSVESRKTLMSLVPEKASASSVLPVKTPVLSDVSVKTPVPSTVLHDEEPLPVLDEIVRVPAVLPVAAVDVEGDDEDSEELPSMEDSLELSSDEDSWESAVEQDISFEKKPMVAVERKLLYNSDPVASVKKSESATTSAKPENPVASAKPENPVASAKPENPIASAKPENPVASVSEVSIVPAKTEFPVAPGKKVEASVMKGESLAQREVSMSDVPVVPRDRVALLGGSIPSGPYVHEKVRVKDLVEHHREQPLWRINGYVPPSLDFLDYQPPVMEYDVLPEHLIENARVLEKTLETFGIRGEVQEILPGPVITIYEYLPEPGIKVSRIAGLADDLAMALHAVQVRVIAPIPGKGVVGIEIPNQHRETVYLKEILADEQFAKTDAKLPMAIGKTTTGVPYVANLAKMPHLLIAGTTGSGKSVGVNAMICSLLYHCSPDEVRFLMVDPKMLELSIYDGIPHLLLPVMTEPKKAAVALNWAVAEMERRYSLMAEAGVRNITNYNRLIERRVAMRDQMNEQNTNWHEIRKAREEAFLQRQASLEQKGREDAFDGEEEMEDVSPEELIPEKPDRDFFQVLPYIVVVIDELADLMMVAAKDVEFAIARLAQMARASGIHLLLATQRPSVDVLTGVIKANFPSRMAFQVKSKIDSRTILDQGGAEKLLGAGDLLLLPPTSGISIRLHGAYLSEEEIHRIVRHLKKQGKPEYDQSILAEEEAEEEPVDAEVDPMYDKAVEIVVRTRNASISFLQRKLRIGYNRSARIVEMMEKEGVVGEQIGNRPRDILVPPPEEE